MIDLTTIILTKNEEKNIAECIKSVQSISKRIVVIDSYSNDNTVKIAKSLGAEVYLNEFVNYSKQFKYGMEYTSIDTKWIFRLDADERLTLEASKEIELICKENEFTNVNGIIIRFEVTFMGKKLRHGGIYPFRKLLVFKRGYGNIEDRYMDEHIILSKGYAVEIKNDCIHYDYKDLTYWIAKHNWYSSREVKDFYNTKINNEALNSLDKRAKAKRFIKFNIYYKLPMGLRAHFYFIYRYYIRLGFLDGKEGLIFNFLQAYWYRFLVDSKIYEYEKYTKHIEETGDLKVYEKI